MVWSKGGSNGGMKWLDSGYILKAEIIGFANWLHVYGTEEED